MAISDDSLELIRNAIVAIDTDVPQSFEDAHSSIEASLTSIKDALGAIADALDSDLT
ncbi:hypothetical protein ACI1US_00985 [Leucobacter sp. BZR 635]